MSNSYNEQYRSYWQSLRKHLLSIDSPFEPRKPLGGSDQSRYAVVSVDNKPDLWVKLEVGCSVDKDWIYVQLVLMRREKWKRFRELESQAEVLQEKLRGFGVHDQLDWAPEPVNDTPRLRITRRPLASLCQECERNEWLADRVLALWRVFHEHIRELR